MIERNAALERVLQMPRIWRARDIAPVRARRSGFSDLDAVLPGHGWPLSSLIEIIPTVEAIGELQLLMPLLRKLCAEQRDVVFVRPPHLPYPPALAKAGLPLNRILWIEATSDEDAHWVAEQSLREGAAGAVMLWSEIHLDTPLRRLQLAAREGDTLAFLYRSAMALKKASPAAVRLALHPDSGGLRVDVLKAQGGRIGTVHLKPSEAA